MTWTWRGSGIIFGAVVAVCGCGERKPATRVDERLAGDVAAKVEYLETISLSRADLAKALAVRGVRVGPGARSVGLQARVSCEWDAACAIELLDNERFAVAGNAFRVSGMNDYSAVLTLGDGEQLMLADGIAAYLIEARHTFLADVVAANVMDESGPLRETTLPLVQELLSTSQVMSHSLGRVPGVLAAALEDRRGGGRDVAPVEAAIRELLEAGPGGVPAATRNGRSGRVRLSIDDETRKTLGGLLP